jgi:hypothetical protein
VCGRVMTWSADSTRSEGFRWRCKWRVAGISGALHTCSRRGARPNASHHTSNSCISSPAQTGHSADFPALKAPRDGPAFIAHVRYQVRPSAILIIVRLGLLVLFLF